MILLTLICVVFLIQPGVYCSNNTITDEVFFDIKVTGDKRRDSWKGRFVVGVFGDVLPITAYNYVHLAKGYQHRNEKWHYKGCLVHMIVPDFVIQTGDVIYKDGRGGRGIYAPFFIDEDFVHSHKCAGLVGMANSGIDMNHSQFYVTLTKARWLDNKNVVIGKVISGMDVIRRLGETEVDVSNRPVIEVRVMDSGALKLKEPYDLTEEEMEREDDVRKRQKLPTDESNKAEKPDEKQQKKKKDEKQKKKKKNKKKV